MSPSTRRAWIEIVEQDYDADENPSPSTRRAWIEIVAFCISSMMMSAVALHPEGVDRNRRGE